MPVLPDLGEGEQERFQQEGALDQNREKSWTVIPQEVAVRRALHACGI